MARTLKRTNASKNLFDDDVTASLLVLKETYAKPEDRGEFKLENLIKGGDDNQILDEVQGPFEIEFNQNKVNSSHKREFYMTMMSGHGGRMIPVFWAAGKRGTKRDEKCDLGCPRRFASDIPDELTFKMDGSPPKELAERWVHCVVKMGYASFSEDASYMYLVVIPDNWKPHQKRFGPKVDDPAKIYGLTLDRGEMAVDVTVGVTTAVLGAEAIATAGAAAGFAAIGVTATTAVILTGGALLAIAGTAALTYGIVRGIKATAGQRLLHVTRTEEEAKTKSTEE